MDKGRNTIAEGFGKGSYRNGISLEKTLEGASEGWKEGLERGWKEAERADNDNSPQW